MDRIKALGHRIDSCFLFQRNTAEMNSSRKIWFWVWNWGIIVVLSLLLGVLSLLLACGTRGYGIFWSYFKVPMILLLNLLPPLLLMLLFYAATGRSWIAWLVTSLLILAPSLINFYMFSFRDDPFFAKDILLMREGAAIMGNYTITLNARVWIALLSIPVGALLLGFLARGKLSWRPRVAVLAALLLCAYPVGRLYTSQTIYEEHTENYEYLSRKRTADRFMGKGFCYPFLFSVGELFQDMTEGASQEPMVELSGDEATLTVQSTPAEQDVDPSSEGQEPPVMTTYISDDIPDDKKVDVVMIMLEAFSDLTPLGIDGIADDVYSGWRELEAQSYHGNLVTNIFAAGTVNTERCALTGDFWVPPDGYTENTGSYVRYLADQGYTVTGSHPIYEWFYNRKDINAYIGFESYNFWESRYQDMVGDISEYLYRDDLFLDDVFQLYLEGTGRTREPIMIPLQREVPVADPAISSEPESPISADPEPIASTEEPPAEPPAGSVEPASADGTDSPEDAPDISEEPVLPPEPLITPPATTFETVYVPSGESEIVPLEGAGERKPYFGFHVTYQGHATYSDHALGWGDGLYTAPEGVSSAAYYIMNNYLGSIRNTILNLQILVERLAEQSEPVVLVLFGDHKPWLGYHSSVYQELGINLDTDTEEGFYNYYTTPYLIWANDAAKELLGSDFLGEGPDISPAYLMNELFDLCGWDGPAFMQLMDDLKPLLPVVNTDDYYVERGSYTEALSKQAQKALDSVQQVEDYRRTHVGDMKIVTEKLP